MKQIVEFTVKRHELSFLTLPPPKKPPHELKQMEDDLIALRDQIGEKVEGDPQLILKIVDHLLRQRITEDLVTKLRMVRNFLFFQTSPIGWDRSRWHIGDRFIIVTEKAIGLADLIERLFPWANAGNDPNRIPVSEWMEMAELGVEILKQYIDGPYNNSEEAEELFKPFYPVFLKTARALQENPSYLAVIQLVHTVDSY